MQGRKKKERKKGASLRENELCGRAVGTKGASVLQENERCGRAVRENERKPWNGAGVRACMRANLNLKKFQDNCVSPMTPPAPLPVFVKKKVNVLVDTHKSLEHRLSLSRS